MVRPKVKPEIKRKRSYMRLNDQEKQIVEEKAARYGYKSVAAYLRDAGIHENIYVEELEGKNEVLQKSSELIDLVREYRNDQKNILLRSMLTPEDIRMKTRQMEVCLLKALIAVSIMQYVNLWPI